MRVASELMRTNTMAPRWLTVVTDVRQAFARGVLLGGRDRVLKIENDRIGTALMRVGDEPGRACRNIEQRADQERRLRQARHRLAPTAAFTAPVEGTHENKLSRCYGRSLHPGADF